MSAQDSIKTDTSSPVSKGDEGPSFLIKKNSTQPDKPDDIIQELSKIINPTQGAAAPPATQPVAIPPAPAAALVLAGNVRVDRYDSRLPDEAAVAAAPRRALAAPQRATVPETPAVPVPPAPLPPVPPAPVPPAPKSAEPTPAPGGNKPPDGPSATPSPERPDKPEKHWQKLVAEAAAKNPPRPTSRWGVAVAAVVIVLLVGALFYLFISNSSLQQKLTASEKQVEQLTKANAQMEQKTALIELYKIYYPRYFRENVELQAAYAKLKADNAGFLTGFNAANQEIAELKAKLAAAKKAASAAPAAKTPKGTKAVETKTIIPSELKGGTMLLLVPGKG